MFRLLTAFSLFLFASLQSSAQDPFFFHFNTLDGLPSSETYDVEQDGSGYIWCTTDRGVCRYDGYSFQTFTMRDGLSSEVNYKLRTSPDGNLWVLTSAGGIDRLSGNRFKAVDQSSGVFQLTQGAPLSQLMFDSSQNPLLYARADELMHGNDRALRKANAGLPTFYKLQKGRFSRQQATGIRHYSNPRDTLKLSLCIGDKREAFLWAYTFGFVQQNTMRDERGIFFTMENVLHYWDFATGKLQRCMYHRQQVIQALYTDRQHNLWVITRSGLFMYPDGNVEQQPKQYFQGYNFTGMVQDREGNYWVSSWNRGVLMVPSFAFHQILLRSRLPGDRVLALKVFSDRLFAGTSQNRLQIINKQMEAQELFCHNHQRHPNGLIEYMTEVDGELWISGGHRYIVQQGKAVELPGTPNFTRFVYKLKNGTWVNGVPMSLTLTNHLDAGQKKFIPSVLISPSRLFAVCEEQQGTVWLGTADGLLRVDGYAFEKPYKVGNQYPFLSGRIADIAQSPGKNLLVFATRDNGLVLKKGNTFYHYNADSGLVSNHINKVLFQNDSVLWVCSNKGLMRLFFVCTSYGVRLLHHQQFNASDGLLSNFVNDVAVWNDKLFIATNEGLNMIPLKQVRPFAVAPVLAGLQLHTVDSSYAFSGQPIQLHYSDNYVELAFTGICFRKPENRLFYRYRLLGLGSGSSWQNTNERHVRFINLPPGDYRFEVQARNKNNFLGSLSDIHFSIAPHYSQTWWFRTSLVLALLAVIMLLFQWQLNSARKKAMIRSQLKGAELKWKQAELDALRNQMNPHFVYNSLNSIQNFIFRNDMEQANDYIARFSRLMRSSLEYSRLEFISLKDEMEFVANYLFLEKKRFDERFDYTVRMDAEINPSEVFIPPLMLQPVLENCVKHAFRNMEATGLIEVDVAAGADAQHIRITVRDNGCGINGRKPAYEAAKNGKKQSLGIDIIRRRMELLQEKFPGSSPSFSITSETGHGTVVLFNLPFETIWV